MAYEEYNELTKRLVAEGYTVENYPEYVHLPGRSYWKTGKGDPLNNFAGGFEYFYWYAAERTYKTPCGLLCKGKFTHAGLSWMGTDYKHENDIVTIRCPKGQTNCKLRDEPFKSAGEGVMLMTCSVRHTEEKWQYQGSCEELRKLYDAEILRKRTSFELEKHGRVCRNHMHFDEKSQEWKFSYDPEACASGFCDAMRGLPCPVLGRKLGVEKGNVYFDIEYEGRDYSKDGTLFEGERIHQIIKGVQVFSKPIRLDIARIYAKQCKDRIWQKARYNTNYFDALTLFLAERGEVDLTMRVLNIRAEKRAARDFEADIADIEAGIAVVHEFDRKKAEKAYKSERRRKAKEKRTAATEKKIIENGFDALEMADKRRVEKLLGSARIDELETRHYEALREKEDEPKQMTIFDML